MQNEAAGYCKPKAIVSPDIELGGVISKRIAPHTMD